MASEAPERIWAFYAPEIEEDNPQCTIVAGEQCMHGAKEYIRADHALALVAEAYGAAAEFAADTADQEQAEDGVVWADLGQVVDAIESRTPADALAAREARDKRIREEALREAEKTARDYGKESYAAKMIGDAILALIEGDTDDQE